MASISSCVGFCGSFGCLMSLIASWNSFCAFSSLALSAAVFLFWASLAALSSLESFFFSGNGGNGGRSAICGDFAVSSTLPS